MKGMIMTRIDGEFVDISTGDYLIYQQLKRIADDLEEIASLLKKPEPEPEAVLTFDEIMERYSRVYNELMNECINKEETK